MALPTAWKTEVWVGVPDSITGATSRNAMVTTRIAASLVMDKLLLCVPEGTRFGVVNGPMREQWRGHTGSAMAPGLEVSATPKKLGRETRGRGWAAIGEVPCFMCNRAGKSIVKRGSRV